MSLEAHESSLETLPEARERAIRLLFLAKKNTLKTIVGERIARANRTRGEPRQLPDLLPGGIVDIWRVPERKDQSGWRGPCETLKLAADGSSAIVEWNGLPYIISMRHIRKHVGFIRQLEKFYAK